MDMMEKMKHAVEKGLQVSKEALGKAGDAARDLGEVGVLKLEIRELENRIKDLLRSLGIYVYEQLGKEGKASVTGKNPEISTLILALENAEKEIEIRKDKIERLKSQGKAPESGSENS
jgi:hypothetical protein